jgi:hypothetical protein
LARLKVYMRGYFSFSWESRGGGGEEGRGAFIYDAF